MGMLWGGLPQADLLVIVLVPPWTFLFLLYEDQTLGSTGVEAGGGHIGGRG